MFRYLLSLPNELIVKIMRIISFDIIRYIDKTDSKLPTNNHPKKVIDGLRLMNRLFKEIFELVFLDEYFLYFKIKEFKKEELESRSKDFTDYHKYMEWREYKLSFFWEIMIINSFCKLGVDDKMDDFLLKLRCFRYYIFYSKNFDPTYITCEYPKDEEKLFEGNYVNLKKSKKGNYYYVCSKKSMMDTKSSWWYEICDFHLYEYDKYEYQKEKKKRCYCIDFYENELVLRKSKRKKYHWMCKERKCNFSCHQEIICCFCGKRNHDEYECLDLKRLLNDK
ncbi:3320_t:CDS:1 [Scutellospora calospora]|uniref:3320_t:CDS:1 n=1 Tax=Scutellospora calospora TaxID=85575 RepID=A0ACA9K9J5_9GLOM|nr:3320_t:CDS:1 [Scutellospora calospora]